MKGLLHKLKAHWMPEDQERSFWEHLEIFRKLLIRCLVTVAVAILLCIPLTKPILVWLQAPLKKVAAHHEYAVKLITTSPIEAFQQIVKVICMSGVLLSLPLLIGFAMRFVLPGLKPKERKALFIGGCFGALFFAAGAAFCYYLSLPIALNIMLDFNEVLGTVAAWKIENYLEFTLQLMIGFGLAFELPLILIGIGSLGMVTPHQLRKYRRHVVIGILILAMVLTPPDVTSQLQMAIPLYLLYECCIGVLSLLKGRKYKGDEL